ncbi:hypothetical protein KQI41_00065 [Tissierella pigra]|uniref:hypothetical protein n=1 Tax=Tissierella pigra TaxID=2607614 RepID=UPI001C0F8214|nr:hypothetical protein [Tissierella pigra]MBU5424785.1 hypothetical protein [Tissierella pigra]
MWKKILASLFIGASLLAISSVGNAATEDAKINTEQKIDITKYQVINPEKKAYSTEDKITFINGKAPSGTEVTIEVYGTTDLTRKNFDLLKLPDEDDYIEISSDTIKSGNMGFFDKELELVTGINKIIVIFEVEDVPPIEIIVYVKTTDTGNHTNEVKLTDIITILK